MLLIRGKDGVIRCFYNTCQHRGAPVVRDEAGSQNGYAVNTILGAMT